MGEIYPIGGLGSRLDLKSKKGEPLPVAALPFCGRTLLEGLVRDVQAREFLYFKIFGKQITTPIAMMTSHEKQNGARVRAICEKKRWFGRPKEAFRLFSQLSVPVVTEEGTWSMRAPLELNTQPGGHGALWRTADEQGIFFWFQEQEKHRLLIRQINNPIGGIDHGLLALVGVGTKLNKTLGFASCPRLEHAAEGILALREKGGEKALCNIEYTDFQNYEIKEAQLTEEQSAYPANTNILYADLKKILPTIKKAPLPGLILNMKGLVRRRTHDGSCKELKEGRLESMMQNISESLTSASGGSLPTFLTYNERGKTISATKKSFEPNYSLLETPEGVFYDLLHNGYELLKIRCHFDLPPFSTAENYLQEGPSLIFLYHPALGPLFSLIEQKIQDGKMGWGSEMQLEIAEIFIRKLDLEGSLIIEAENLLGHSSQGIIRYSHKTGKCVLKNVLIRNDGIERQKGEPFWKNRMKRKGALKVILQGHSEFWADSVSFVGNQTFIVPDGERWIATQERGKVTILKELADSQWNYKFDPETSRLSIEYPAKKL